MLHSGCIGFNFFFVITFLNIIFAPVFKLEVVSVGKFDVNSTSKLLGKITKEQWPEGNISVNQFSIKKNTD